MLVLSRKLNEKIVLDGSIRITVVGLRGNQVRIGIEAPDSIKVFREEICTPTLVAREAWEPTPDVEDVFRADEAALAHRG